MKFSTIILESLESLFDYHKRSLDDPSNVLNFQTTATHISVDDIRSGDSNHWLPLSSSLNPVIISNQKFNRFEKVTMGLIDTLVSTFIPSKFLDNHFIYPSLAHFFKSCCLRYTYLTGCTFTPQTWLHYLYLFSFPCLFLGTLRFAILLILFHDPYLSKLLGDFSFFMGDASFWFLFVCLVWFTVACFSRVINELSNFRLKWQLWIKPMVFLEHPEYTRDLRTQNGARLALIILRFNLIAAVVCACAVHLPILTAWPITWLPWTLFITTVTGFHGYLIGAYEVNFTIIVALYLYVYGRKYHRLADATISTIALTKTDSSDAFTHFFERFKHRMISWTREIFKINQFLCYIMNAIFVGTFIAETLCIYLTFFVSLSGATKYVIIFLGVLTIIYGQMICFLYGSYAQHRYNECVNQLHHLIEFKAMKIPLSLRLKSLIASEYLTERKIFLLLATIDVSTMNFIKVQVEMAMLLLMLIGNVK